MDRTWFIQKPPRMAKHVRCPMHQPQSDEIMMMDDTSFQMQRLEEVQRFWFFGDRTKFEIPNSNILRVGLRKTVRVSVRSRSRYLKIDFSEASFTDWSRWKITCNNQHFKPSSNEARWNEERSLIHSIQTLAEDWTQAQATTKESRSSTNQPRIL